MDGAELSRAYGGFSTPGFDLTVDTRTLRESDGVVAQLTVETAVDGADRFSAVLAYPFDPVGGEFEGLDPALFGPGTRVEVAVGYGDRREPLFLGTITEVRADFSAETPATVDVSGYGLLHGLMRETRSRSWDEVTDSDVARDVVTEYGFASVTVEDTGLVHRKVVQDRQNDYRFLAERAERNGFEFFARRDALFFRAPERGTDPIVTLRYGEGVRSFSAELNTAEQVGTVTVRHWDPAEKEEIVGVAEADDRGPGRTVVRLPVRSRAEAERLAAATLDEIRAGRVGGTVETVGIPEIRAGETVRLRGFGERFSGDYHVDQATHRIGAAGYSTSFEVTERPV